MIRKLMASSALAALMSAAMVGLAPAQDTNAAQPAIVDQAGQPAVAMPSDETLQTAHPTLATAFMGRTVYSSDAPNSDAIGKVNDLIISDDGRIEQAVVGVGGFLGIGEKDVAVPFGELRVVERDGAVSLIYAATREQLEAAPALDRAAYDPAQRAAAMQPATNVAMAPADQAGLTYVPTGDPLAATPAPAQASANEAAAVAPADLAFVAFNADQLRASDLMGQPVYGPGDESIGSVSDLVLQPDGGARSALIDVGGFLGIGAKTVAIPISALMITPTATNAAATPTPAGTMAPAEQPMAADATTTPAPTAGEALANGDVRVTVAMTKEQLQGMPDYVVPATMAPATDAAMQAPAAGTTAPADAMATPAPMAGAMTTPAPMAGAMATPASVAEGTTTMPMADGAMGGYAAATQQLTARELTGVTVYGPDDSTVGEIGDLVLNKAGDIEAVIVDVGGFLGIGEKPVALSLSDLQVRRDANGTLTVMVPATKDQLTGAPTYTIVR